MNPIHAISSAYSKLISYIDKNEDKLATKYLKEAAINGSIEAQNDYATKMLEEGKTFEAVAWLLEASSMASLSADKTLYTLYLNGSKDCVVRQRYEKALLYAERIRDAGDPKGHAMVEEVKQRISKSQQHK